MITRASRYTPMATPLRRERDGAVARRRDDSSGAPPLFCEALRLIPHPLGLVDRLGAILFANPSLELLLDDATGPLREEIGVMARSVAAHPAPDLGAAPPEDAVTADGHRLRGVMVDLTPFGGRRVVLITVRPAPTEPSTSERELRDRYRLTRQEARVAALLARGLSNDQVARTLFISPHTARRHTERVLAKLGVCSRAAVGAVLRAAS